MKLIFCGLQDLNQTMVHVKPRNDKLHMRYNPFSKA